MGEGKRGQRGQTGGLAITFARLANKGAGQVGKRLPRRLFSRVSLCVCVSVCLEYPDGPMKIIACLARFSTAKDCDAIAPDAAKGIKSKEKKKKEVNVFFCLFALPADLPHTPHSLVKSPSIRGAHLTC